MAHEKVIKSLTDRLLDIEEQEEAAQSNVDYYSARVTRYTTDLQDLREERASIEVAITALKEAS